MAEEWAANIRHLVRIALSNFEPQISLANNHIMWSWKCLFQRLWCIASRDGWDWLATGPMLKMLKFAGVDGAHGPVRAPKNTPGNFISNIFKISPDILKFQGKESHPKKLPTPINPIGNSLRGTVCPALAACLLFNLKERGRTVCVNTWTLFAQTLYIRVGFLESLRFSSFNIAPVQSMFC